MYGYLESSFGRRPISAQPLYTRGRQLGTAAHMLTDRDQVIMSEPDLHRQLISILAGLAARAAWKLMLKRNGGVA